MPPIQQHYYEILMERIRKDRYPSLQLLDRAERAIATNEQFADYVNTLVEKVDETWYPSGDILNRIERMMQMAAAQ